MYLSRSQLDTVISTAIEHGAMEAWYDGREFHLFAANSLNGEQAQAYRNCVIGGARLIFKVDSNGTVDFIEPVSIKENE